MTEEIIVDGVNVAGCPDIKHYNDAEGNMMCMEYVDGGCEGHNCYYKQLKRARIKIEKLKGVDGSVHPDSAYYKITRLEQENEKLKEANKKMYQSMHKEICEYNEELGIEKASHESDLETLDTYRSALEEIREILKKQLPTEVIQGRFPMIYYSEYFNREKQILNKINEVLK